MTALAIFLMAPTVLALFTAAVNYGVWSHRRSERAHLALALACVAGAVLIAATGLVYGADSRIEAIAARTLLALATIPIQLGNVWFVARVHRKSLRGYYHAGAAVALLLACAGLVPGVLYGDGAVTRSVHGLGLAYVDVELTTLGRLAPLALLPGVAALLWRADQLARREPDRGVVLATMLVSNAMVVPDLFTAGGWIDAPYLFGPAFNLASVVYSGLMLRRFVETLARVETSADSLQRAAEERAKELRESDLRLAHGVRLAALGTLAASLAHEINNPVAFIRSNLNFLADATRQRSGEPEIEEVLGETEEGVARLRGIVRELLRMSEQGGAGFADVLLSDVVEAALPTLRFEAGEDVALVAQLTPVPAVRGDRNLLGQVVANLVLNAIQAVRAQGAPGAVRITTFADAQRVVLDISDTGPGVAPELAGRIFEPFFTTKPAGQGTGLGLAVSRQLVERHGGKLALLPSERGAHFQVELPTAHASAAASLDSRARIALAS
jgi:signal transduction histidine kinase